MKKKSGKVKNIILLAVLLVVGAVVIFILIDRAQYADVLYENSDYYREQNGKYN